METTTTTTSSSSKRICIDKGIIPYDGSEGIEYDEEKGRHSFLTIQEDGEYYLGEFILVNTTPHPIVYKNYEKGYMITIPSDKNRQLRAENIKGDETKNMPFPCFDGNYELQNKIKVKQMTIVIASTITANAFSLEYQEHGDEAAIHYFGTDAICIVVPNTSPGYHERDEKGNITGVYEFLTYFNGIERYLKKRNETLNKLLHEQQKKKDEEQEETNRLIAEAEQLE